MFLFACGSNSSLDSNQSKDAEVKTDNVKKDLQIIADINSELYTYDSLQNDIEALKSKYPQYVTSDVLTTTVDKRNVDCLIIGDKDASKKIFVTAAIHAREWRTSQVLISEISDFLTKLTLDESYKNSSYSQLMKGCAIYAVPMVNPDGVCIAQGGLSGLQTESAKERVANIAKSDG
ncbi:MAG: hypothetical protein MJ189_03595, partial [Coriobacteriales bacterium]|nr:hypothetical protein [Coriobacteriales bacterium]